VALPFPPSDSLYGSQPDPTESFGINLGTIAARGERGALIVSLDMLLRETSNPFSLIWSAALRNRLLRALRT